MAGKVSASGSRSAGGAVRCKVVLLVLGIGLLMGFSQPVAVWAGLVPQ